MWALARSTVAAVQENGQGRASGSFAKGFDNVRVLIGIDYGTVAVEFNFEEPLGAVRQFRDWGAVHRFDEIGGSFWQGLQVQSN